MNIRKIEAHKPIEQKKLRVAAYCRISTDYEEQASSYQTQIQHYEEVMLCRYGQEVLLFV